MRKHQALIVVLLSACLSTLSTGLADEIKDKEWINIGRSEGSEEISIKNIKKLGDNELSYQNMDNNIILVRCEPDKSLVRYWYFQKINTSDSKKASIKMQWHRPVPQSRAQLESEFICNNAK